MNLSCGFSGASGFSGVSGGQSDHRARQKVSLLRPLQGLTHFRCVSWGFTPGFRLSALSGRPIADTPIIRYADTRFPHRVRR